MPILGYGEDALTLHGLTRGLASIFDQLEDDSDPGKALAFYRPSFGRRGSAPSGSPSSQFGEFDAIVGTPRAVCIVETKWAASGELDGTDLLLRPEQLRRHAAFRSYLEEWRRERSTEWTSFAVRMRPILEAQGQRLAPPSTGTTLGRNLGYVLRRWTPAARRLSMSCYSAASPRRCRHRPLAAPSVS